MATLGERLQSLRDRLKRKKEAKHPKEALWSWKAKRAREEAARRKAAGYNPDSERIPEKDLRDTVAKQDTAKDVAMGVAVGIAGVKVAQKAAGYYVQAFSGINPNKRSRRGGRLTKAERKELKAQGISTRRSSMEPSKYVRAKKTKRIQQAVESVQQESMGYQNLREDRTPQSRGINSPIPSQQQAMGMDSLIPMDALREQRDVYLAEPERFKTHRTYSNMDFVGKNSKRGAVDWRWDLSEMFR